MLNNSNQFLLKYQKIISNKNCSVFMFLYLKNIEKELLKVILFIWLFKSCVYSCKIQKIFSKWLKEIIKKLINHRKSASEDFQIFYLKNLFLSLKYFLLPFVFGQVGKIDLNKDNKNLITCKMKSVFCYYINIHLRHSKSNFQKCFI